MHLRLDYVFCNWEIQQQKFAPKFAKVGSTFWQQCKPSRNGQKLLKIYQSGEISSNLVILSVYKY